MPTTFLPSFSSPLSLSLATTLIIYNSSFSTPFTSLLFRFSSHYTYNILLMPFNWLFSFSSLTVPLHHCVLCKSGILSVLLLAVSLGPQYSFPLKHPPCALEWLPWLLMLTHTQLCESTVHTLHARNCAISIRRMEELDRNLFRLSSLYTNVY